MAGREKPLEQKNVAVPPLVAFHVVFGGGGALRLVHLQVQVKVQDEGIAHQQGEIPLEEAPPNAEAAQVRRAVAKVGGLQGLVSKRASRQAGTLHQAIT